MKFKFTKTQKGGYLNNKKVTPKKSLVIGILVGGIIFGSLGVFAATYFSASQVSFTPTNENWNVTNVEEAIDSLYETTKDSISDFNIIIEGLNSAETVYSRTLNATSNNSGYASSTYSVTETAIYRIISNHDRKYVGSGAYTRGASTITTVDGDNINVISGNYYYLKVGDVVDSYQIGYNSNDGYSTGTVTIQKIDFK